VSDSLVRLALIGPAAVTTLSAKMLERVRKARVAAVAESMNEALCDQDQFDAVILHSFSDARRAAKLGKHLLVNARSIPSIEEAGSLIESCRAGGAICALSELPRHASASRAILDRLASGKLGVPGLLRVHRWQSPSECSLSSMIFGDVDLALHLFHAVPTDIYAVGHVDHSYLQVHLAFPGGGMALLDFSRRLPPGRAYDSLSLIGSRGAAYADDHQNTHLLFQGGDPAALIQHSGNGRLVEFQEFVDCVARGSSPAVNRDVIATVHRVTAAIGGSLEASQVLHERGGQYEPA